MYVQLAYCIFFSRCHQLYCNIESHWWWGGVFRIDICKQEPQIMSDVTFTRARWYLAGQGRSMSTMISCRTLCLRRPTKEILNFKASIYFHDCVGWKLGFTMSLVETAWIMRSENVGILVDVEQASLGTVTPAFGTNCGTLNCKAVPAFWSLWNDASSLHSLHMNS